MAPENTEPPPPTPRGPPEESDPPPIGIVHLVVWTAGVAVYLSLERARGQMFGPSAPFGGTFLEIGSGILESLAYGAALAGLLLWTARRWRGLPFPRHPGEYLLVVIGLNQALRFSYVFLAYPVTNERLKLLTALMYGHFALQCLVLVWPLLAVKSRRWRVFFGTLLASHVLLPLDIALSVHLLRTPAISHGLLFSTVVLYVAADAILLVIVLKDRWEGIRYPWTHWLGVAVGLWLALTGISTYVRLIVEQWQLIFR